MTTEDDFQAALDANPEDHATRLVFADWLQERDDPRAEGYRALGRLLLRAIRTRRGWWVFGCGESIDSKAILTRYRCSVLPAVWYSLIQPSDLLDQKGLPNKSDAWVYFNVRRECEDAAALAFAKLPPEHRAELLATPPNEK